MFLYFNVTDIYIGKHGFKFNKVLSIECLKIMNYV
jgi:hypothetical protein